MKKALLITFLTGTYITLKAQTAGTNLSSYTDISPDTLLNYTAAPYTNETYSINVFPDASLDVEFTAHGAVSSGGSATYIKVTSINPNVYISFGRWDSVFTIANSTWNVTRVAKPLNLGDAINTASTTWDNTVLYLTDHSGSGGGNKNVNDWVGGDKYLGLKYQNGSSATYGWIRVRCKSADSCYIKDFSSGSPSSSGIQHNTTDQLSLFPNPAYNHLYLDNINENTFNSGSLQLTDMLGRSVKCNSSFRNNRVEINLKDLPEGCYLLNYITNSRSYTKKIIKMNE